MFEKSHQTKLSRTSSRRLVIECMEHRMLLTSLGEFRLDAPSEFEVAEFQTFAKSDHSSDDTQLSTIGAGFDADLTYLANHVDETELDGLDLLQGQLRQLLGRELQLEDEEGESIEDLSNERFSGTPWTEMYLADESRPHVHLYLDDINSAAYFLAGVGMEITDRVDTETYQVVAGYVPISALRNLVNTPGLRSVVPSERPYADHQGTVVNVWESVSGADQFKLIRPADNGTDIRIGVISDSVGRVGNGLKDSTDADELPTLESECASHSDPDTAHTGVCVLDDAGTGAVVDEGRAMLELIHDVANGASLSFHTGFVSAANTAQGYRDLRADNVDIIADDIAYFSEPVFQRGMISQAVDEVVASDNILVFGSAGNRNGETYSASWSNSDNDRYHNFTNADETIDFQLDHNESITVHLHWSQPWQAATTDIDIEIWNSAVTAKLDDSDIDNTPAAGTGNPYDRLTFTNSSGATQDYNLMFNVVDGANTGAAAAGLQLQMYAPGARNYFTGAYTQNEPGINPNRNANKQFVLGAASIVTPDTIRNSSSRGPTTRRFNEAGNALAAPIVKQYPNFYANDGVGTSVPGFGPGASNFSGTSAAAPNAAAIAALALDAAGDNGRGDLTFEQLEAIFKLTAEGPHAGAWAASNGFGRINGLLAPMAARGPGLPEFYIELNQFGNGTTMADLESNSDVDAVRWGNDAAGTTEVTVTTTAPALDPAAILFNVGNQDGLIIPAIGANEDDLPSDNVKITFTSNLDSVYQIDPFSETDLDGAPSNPITVNVDAPDQALAALGLDERADVSVSSLLGSPGDTDYYRVVAPHNAVGGLSVTLTPEEALDGVISVFNDAGDLISRQTTSPGTGEALIQLANGVDPGDEFVIRVGSNEYTSSGTYDLSINFTNVPSLPLTWTDAVDGILVPGRLGVFMDAQGITPDPFIGLAGEADSFYFGLNTANTEFNDFFGVGAIADSPSSVEPAMAIYKADTGELVGFSPNGPGGSGFSNFSATMGTRYIAAVADETGTQTGDVRIVGGIGSNTASTTPIPLNGAGDGSISLSVPQGGGPAIPAGGEVAFYRFVPPGGATGNGTITFDAGDADGEIWLFDTSSRQVGFSRSAGPGSSEVLTITGGFFPGDTYTLVVLPQNYAADIQLGTIVIDLEADTGTATGTSFDDANRNGTKDEGEAGLPGRRIYHDENRNGQFDPLEENTITGADGSYTLTSLPFELGPSGAFIRQEEIAGFEITAPSQGGTEIYFSPSNTDAEVNFGSFRELDRGDAPVSYGTLDADSGPSHYFDAAIQLGSSWDGELDGSPSSTASGDGSDEDGVTLPARLVPGEMTDIEVSATGGTLDAWIDFNLNGTFEAGERIATAEPMSAGTNMVSFEVPEDATLGDTFARFRLSTEGVAEPTGFGDVGEVEDYSIRIDDSSLEIVNVLVGSTGWTHEFRSQEQFFAGFFPIDDAPIPWVIDEIMVVFSGDATVGGSDLLIFGMESPIGIEDFFYEESMDIGIWNIAPVSLDKLLLGIPATIGLPEDFIFRIDVIAGDTNRSGTVAVTDLGGIRKALGKDRTSPDYSIFADLDGSGGISVSDVPMLRAHLGFALPPGEPTPPPASRPINGLAASDVDAFMQLEAEENDKRAKREKRKPIEFRRERNVFVS